MSSITWTVSALASERHLYSGTAWRVVESQNKATTWRLTETFAEQDRLEQLLEASKPPYPPNCTHLDYLLKTPFRYRPPNPHGSRFRRPHDPRGIFYAAETQRTAISEAAFYRVLFFSGTSATTLPRLPVEHTVFSVSIETSVALDLTIPPLVRDAHAWTALTDYDACRQVCDSAREAACKLLRYQSVRDMEQGTNVAVLDADAFRTSHPVARQTWNSVVKKSEVIFYRPAGAERYCFEIAQFALDPRIKYDVSRDQSLEGV